MNFCFWKYFPFLLHVLTCFPTIITSQPDFVFNSCMESSGNYTKNSSYETNLKALLASLPSGMDSYGFNSSSFGLTPNTVYAISLCRGDVEINTCRDCVHDAIRKLPKMCPNSKEAIGWYDYCMLRYSNESINGQYTSELPRFDVWNTSNVSSKDQFNEVLDTFFIGLRKSASNGGDHKKFATNHTIGPDHLTIYGMMQCTPELSMQFCDNCLSDSASLATSSSSNCSGKKGCRVLNPSCNVRYEVYQFFNDISSAPSNSSTNTSSARPSPPMHGSTEKVGNAAQTTIIIVTSIVGFGIVLILCICIFLKKKKHKKPRQRVECMDKYGNIHDISSVDSLLFDFGIISDATNKFSHTNKLGEGGFGAVYRGRLQNGQEIAVKRLSRNSGQGEHEFKNEVMLMAKLQHRNLVRLLGFSLEGPERLLIYEFVTNGSLDQFIFNPIKRMLLNWDVCHKIIIGIAKGLLYLHEDSRLRIIHRDLKASNVLLNSEMNPKISDFGMARLFLMDETHGSTRRVVGTYGYMAPEYAMHGHFSVKSDVFSFGVLILEIVTGQKNNYFTSGDNVKDLLSNAWESWRDGTAPSLIDPTLISSSGSIREITRCIHIGLLCVQENVAKRPTMASVNLMLSSTSTSLAMPSQPAFFLDGDISGMTNKSITWISTSTLPSENEASITELYPR